MENRNYILSELREISPVVAEIGNQNPYTVPARYFEGLAGQLLQRIRETAKADEAGAPVLPKTANPYQVPQGYFEGLAAQLLNRAKANDITLSPVLQQAGNNPYEVPQGYFEGLAGQLLQRVKGSDITLSPALQKAGNNPYQVPQGYFEGLADQLLQRVKANDGTLSPALQQAGNNPYQVPQGYFDNLPATILNRIKAEQADNANDELEILSPLLSGISKKSPFSAPAGYFDELTENAIAGAQAIEFVNGELENLSPLMNSLRKENVYEVPADYFEQLPGQVLNAVKAQEPAKVVSIGFGRRMLGYAAAAVVAGIIVVAGWLFIDNKQGNIKSSDNTPGTEVAKSDLDSISDDILEKYLENQLAAPAETAVAATNSNDANIDASDMKDMLADVSDEDLQQYLEKYSISTTKDIQTN
jgi:hypothetical protein